VTSVPRWLERRGREAAFSAVDGERPGGGGPAFERVADEDLMWYDVEEREDLIAYFG